MAFKGISGTRLGKYRVSFVDGRTNIRLTPSPSPSIAISPSVTPSISVSPSVTPSISISNTPSITPSISISPTPSITPSISISNTPSITPSISISNTPSVTPSISISATPSITPSISVSISPSTTPSISISNTPSITPSISISRTPSVTPTNTVSNTPSVTPLISISRTPSVTPSVTPSSAGGIVSSGLIFNLQSAPSSGTTWTDTSGNGYNATLQGSSSYTGSFNGGIKLNNDDNGGTDYISVPYNINTSTVTVEVVASFNPTSFWGVIWGNEVYYSDAGYFAYMDSSTTLNYGKPTSESSKTITASNAVRQWIFVIDGTQHSLYLNGSQVGTTDTVSIQTLFTSNNFYFGARHNNGGTGFVDVLNNSNSSLQPVFYQMRLYNRALSGAEITQNYNAIKSTYGL